MSIMTSLIPSDLDSLLVVRTVTVFLPAPYCAPSIFVPSLDRAVSHAKALRGALQAAGITVQTIRVSLPGPSIFGSPSAALSAAKELDRLDLDYANLGCVHPSDSAFVSSDFYEAVLVSTSSVSLSAQLTAAPGVISPPAVRAAADAVARISHLTAAGFSNFRFAASAHVLPGGPFFPTSYATTELSAASSMNDPPPAALGIQGGTLLSAIVSRSRSPQLALETFRACVQAGVNRLIDICAAVAPVSVDFSTAPLPEDGHGVGEPLRQLANVQNFPSAGGLAAAARVAAAIDAASFPRAGFCGIMLPVSEDSVLSANPPKLQDLLMCSSVCGTGLDVRFADPRARTQFVNILSEMITDNVYI